VLLGAAILGAVATKKYNSLREAMKALNAAGQVWTPFFQSLFTLYKTIFILRLENKANVIKLHIGMVLSQTVLHTVSSTFVVK
jgi:ribulose kinase